MWRGLIITLGNIKKPADALCLCSESWYNNNINRERRGFRMPKVFDIVDEWAEVDICGWHCLMLSKFLTVEKESASAD